MDRRLGQRAAARRARAARVAVPERRRQADRSRGRRSTWRRRCGRTCSCRTPSTGSSRSPSRSRSPAPGRGCEDDLAVGHYKPINSKRFLHDCHEFVFHFTPNGTTPLDRQAVGVRYQDQSNVAAGRTPPPACAAAATPGSSPTRRSRAATRTGRTRPPSRRKLPEMCLRLHGLDRLTMVADPFLGLGSTAVACAQLGLNFIGIEMDEGYLKEAIDRTRAALAAREQRERSAAGVARIGGVESMRRQACMLAPWTSASSRSSAPSPTPARSPPPAKSSTCRSRPSAGRSCCSKTSSASRSSTASAGASASRPPASRCCS